jgi:hypothetical protein
MELKINLGYNELFNLIKQLPSNELFQLKIDLSKIEKPEKINIKNKKLKTLLLKGPTMSDEQFDSFQSNRQWINQWRTEN